MKHLRKFKIFEKMQGITDNDLMEIHDILVEISDEFYLRPLKNIDKMFDVRWQDPDWYYNRYKNHIEVVIFSSYDSGISKIREIRDYINANIIHRIESIGFNVNVRKMKSTEVNNVEGSIRIQIY